MEATPNASNDPDERLKFLGLGNRKVKKDVSRCRSVKEDTALKKWLQLLRDRSMLRQTKRQALTIANESQRAVWDRVQNSIYTMPVSEARGYVRARSAAVIRDQTSQLLGKRHRFSDRMVTEMQRLATERVIHLVLVELLSSGTHSRRLAA